MSDTKRPAQLSTTEATDEREPVPGEPQEGAERVLVTLDARRLLSPSGTLLAELQADECWYTPEGLRCRALTVPATRASAHVEPEERARARQELDRAWIDAAVKTIYSLASAQQTLTADDLWRAVEYPPRESRMIGNALSRAKSAGWVETTPDHVNSIRAANHERLIRVWRSLIFTPARPV